MDLKVKTGPSTTSITTDLAKSNVRVTTASEDSLFDHWIEAADQLIALQTNTSLMERVLVLSIPKVIPCIQLPKPPFIDFASVKHWDKDENETSVATGSLRVRTVDMLPTFEIPSISGTSEGRMEIEYQAGYADANTVPVTLKQAALMLVGHWYANREASFMDPRIMNVSKVTPLGFMELINPHRVPTVQGILNDGTL
ncbi:MAG: phage head-tail connector protein [Pseudomonadota bacterium]